ncbi:MAG: helix-turn-helix transcriptional regulator [Clostridia bacterium]|nr:helix-turn-helix transcriptional regulator [Clostridia bacterium]
MKNEDLGAIIKTARTAAHITREELAAKTGYSARYIASIENENKMPSYEKLAKLISVLDIDANDIFAPKKAKSRDRELIIRLIDQCDERGLKIVKSVLKSIVDTK